MAKKPFNPKGKSLETRQREAKALKLYEQGVATREIADMLGVQRPSVNRMIRDARKARAEHLASAGVK